MRPLEGRAAIVTGASDKGIGGAVARRFAASGASLFLTASTEDVVGALLEDCRAAEVDVTFRTYDFTDEGSAEEMVAAALAALRRVDVLVNNAGMRSYKPFGEFDADEFDSVVAVNVRAPFLASQAVLSAMREQGEGRIIHVASQMGVVGARSLSLYSMTKAALISLARSMALELAGERITVNAVSPGPVATGYLEGRFETRPGGAETLREKMPLGRLGEPDEVAEVIHFLATCEGELIQGHNLVMDGGYILH